MQSDKDQGSLSLANSPHVYSELANMPPNTLLDEVGLAVCLNVAPRTVRRMVGRGELPEGVKSGGRKLWIAGRVMEFINAIFQEHMEKAHKERRKLERLIA